MNIGVVTNSLDQYGGAEIYLLECLRRWQTRADITLYAPIIDGDLLSEFGVDTTRIEQVILTQEQDEQLTPDLVKDLLIRPRLWEHELGSHDVYFLNGVPLHFVQCFPSVFMCHEPLRVIYDLRCQPAGNADGAVVHLYPEQEYRQLSARLLEVQLGLLESLDRDAKFDYLAVNSRRMENYARNVYDRKADLVAYPGVELPVQVSPPSTMKRALYVGRLWEHKRLDLLVRAIALLGEGRLDIVGQGPERKRLGFLAQTLGVKDRVIFHGALSTCDVTTLFDQVTCGVYVPIREPFGMMPLEAAAAGRPVIATREGGFSEILTSQSAIYVDPSPRAIATAMKRLFEDPELARRMGCQARAEVEKVTWDRTAEDFFRLFKLATERERKGRTCSLRPLVGAYYYPWYDAGRPMRHWNENTTHAAVADLPLTGAYTSRKTSIIKRHLDLARRAGLDFLTVNWEIGQSGLNAKDLEATERLFESAEQHLSGLKLSIMLSIRTSLLQPVRQTLEHVKRLSRSACWFSLRESPVLWLFISTDLFGCYFNNKLEVERMCSDFKVLTTGAIAAPHCLPCDLQAFVDGWSLFIPFQGAESEEWEQHWASSYRYHVSGSHDPVRVFTVCPGYDDRHLTAAARAKIAPRVVPREDGKVYRRMLECARTLSPPPEVIMINSFNEYHETTQIEPSFLHGDSFLEITRDFTSKGCEISQ